MRAFYPERALTNDSNKRVYSLNNSATGRVSRVVGLGLVSAASALAGGLAVAWWYRKTLTKLQNPIATGDVLKSESGQIEDENLSQPEFDSPTSSTHK